MVKNRLKTMANGSFWSIFMVMGTFCLTIDTSSGRPAHETRILNKTKSPNNRGFFVPDQQAIIFPDSLEVVFETVPRIRGPPKCAGDSTFCEEFEAYPYNQVQKVIEKNGALKPLFGEDEAPSDEIANRIGYEDDRKFMCQSVTKVIYPQLGKTMDNKWKIIVNQGKDEQYIQGVRIETCKRTGPCDIGDLPHGLTTTCVQKYTFRRLLAIDHTNKPTYETFRLPSACCCAYETDQQVLARFGAHPVTPAVIRK